MYLKWECNLDGSFCGACADIPSRRALVWPSKCIRLPWNYALRRMCYIDAVRFPGGFHSIVFAIIELLLRLISNAAGFYSWRHPVCYPYAAYLWQLTGVLHKPAWFVWFLTAAFCVNLCKFVVSEDQGRHWRGVLPPSPRWDVLQSLEICFRRLSALGRDVSYLHQVAKTEANFFSTVSLGLIFFLLSVRFLGHVLSRFSYLFVSCRKLVLPQRPVWTK